mmetsp:Transcript_49295/g.148399  ORF Transcript_49295/g.148399 Transcript_49295/m.148399 type:complete len:442 (-) Transcript_49295:1559-2884(-)
MHVDNSNQSRSSAPAYPFHPHVHRTVPLFVGLLLLLFILLLGLLGLPLGDGLERLDRLLVRTLVRFEVLRHLQSGDLVCPRRQQQDRALKVRNLGPVPLMEAGVRGQQPMGDALRDTHLGGPFVLKVPEGEGQRGELPVDFPQNVPARLHLEAVGRLDVPLEHGGAQVARADLAVPRAHGDVDGVHLPLLELTLGDLFLPLLQIVGSRLTQRDLLNAIDDKPLHLVHPDGGDGADAIGLRNSLHRSGHLGVLGPGADGVSGDQHGVVRSDGSIPDLIVYRRGGVGTLRDDEGVGCNGDVTINVTAEVDLDDVAGLEGLQFFRAQWRVVAHHVVHRNAHREGDALLDGLPLDLLLVELGGLSVDDGRPKLAQVDDLGPREALPDESFEGRVDDLGGLLVFGTNVAVFAFRVHRWWASGAHIFWEDWEEAVSCGATFSIKLFT